LDQDEFDPVLKISAANPTLHLIVLFLLLISTGINTEAKTNKDDRILSSMESFRTKYPKHS